MWGQTPAGQGLGSPQLLPSSVPSTTQSAGKGGAFGESRLDERMDVDIEVDPLGEEGEPAAIFYQISLLRVALSEFEIEARRRVQECVDMGKKMIRMKELGAFMAVKFSLNISSLAASPSTYKVSHCWRSSLTWTVIKLWTST